MDEMHVVSVALLLMFAIFFFVCSYERSINKEQSVNISVKLLLKIYFKNFSLLYCLSVEHSHARLID